LRHACRADWKSAELGSTFPLRTTPKTETDLLPAVDADPGEAWNPCELRQAANAARLGFTDEVVVAPVVEVVPSLATTGALEPPQPSATNARAASPATARARVVICPEKHASLKPV